MFCTYGDSVSTRHYISPRNTATRLVLAAILHIPQRSVTSHGAKCYSRTHDHYRRHVKRFRLPIGDRLAFEEAAVRREAGEDGFDVRPQGSGFFSPSGLLRSVCKLRIHRCARWGLDTICPQHDIAHRRAPVLEAQRHLAVWTFGLAVGDEALAQVDALWVANMVEEELLELAAMERPLKLCGDKSIM